MAEEAGKDGAPRVVVRAAKGAKEALGEGKEEPRGEGAARAASRVETVSTRRGTPRRTWRSGSDSCRR